MIRVRARDEGRTPTRTSAPVVMPCDSAPIALILLLLFLVGPPLFAAPIDPYDTSSLNVRVYYDSDGLPQNSVESMSLDTLGRLWVTTRDGGAVFDGSVWTPVPMPPTAPSNWPRKVLATSDGAVWFGIEPEGLARLQHDEWIYWGEAEGLTGLVNSLAQLDERLLVATDEGIFRFELDSPSPVLELSESSVRVIVSRGGRTLAATSRGEILERRRDSWGSSNLPTFDGVNPTALFIGERDILVGTDDGIWRIASDEEPVRDLQGLNVRSITQTRSKDQITTLWAAAEGGGLLRFVGGTWQVAGPSIPTPNKFVYALLPVPSDGTTEHLVVGTLSGVGRIDLTAWRRIGTEDGLPDSSVVSILESRKVLPGHYFLGTTGGLVTFDEPGGQWTTHPCPELGTAPVFAMLESRFRDEIHFGTDDGVITITSGGCSRNSGLEGESIVSLTETGGASPRLWAGTYGSGLYYREAESSWKEFEESLPDGRIEALVHTGRHEESLWIATNRGLAHWSGDTLNVFDRSDGLPDNVVRCIMIDSSSIWVGTSAGLARADVREESPVWQKVDIDGEAWSRNETIYRCERDSDGRIYAFTGRGIVRLTKPRNREDFVVDRVFLSDDGLPSSETNFGASMVDTRGRIWVGTPRGAGVFAPDQEPDATSPTPVLSLSLKTQPDGRKLEDGAIVSFDVDRIVATFRMIDLAHGSRALYRTQLVGLDDDPSAWTPGAQRTFAKLPGGRFEFRVWARDPHGHESGPVSVEFSVQQPPWLSWWAVLIYVAGSVFILYGLVGLRIRALRKRNDDLELIVRSRTRDLEVAIRQLESANVTLADMSVTDPLTGARNRRFLLQSMENEAVRIRRSTRESDDMVFLLVDIDRFKHLNDRFGHATGDLVLKQFYNVLTAAVRDSDTIVRWGGEEFLIVARKLSRTESVALVERVLNMVREERFESTDSSRRLRLTCSIGFASFPFVTWDRALFTWEQVVDIADHCLYAVKRSGRDGWAGLAAGSQLRADSFLSRMRDDVAAMAAADEVQVMTSVDSPEGLLWR